MSDVYTLIWKKLFANGINNIDEDTNWPQEHKKEEKLTLKIICRNKLLLTEKNDYLTRINFKS